MTPPDPGSILDRIDVVLHRPQSSDNVGAVARAMMNFGLRQLVVVAPRRWEPERAKVLAVGADAILDGARMCPTLEEAVAPYALVIPTTERAVEGRQPPLDPRQTARVLIERAQHGQVAILFGEEARGVSNALLDRYLYYSSIPSDPAKRSLNLAQAVLLYLWELYQESGTAPPLQRPDEAGPGERPAPHQLLDLTRARVRTLMVANGFLNPQQPDKVMDELMRLLQRARPTQREVELLLAGIGQLERTSVVK